eukprot:gene7120-445_t
MEDEDKNDIPTFAVLDRLRSAFEESQARVVRLQEKQYAFKADLTERKSAPQDERIIATRKELQKAMDELGKYQSITASLKKELIQLQEQRNDIINDLQELTGVTAAQHEEKEQKLLKINEQHREYLEQLKGQLVSNQVQRDSLQSDVKKVEEETSSTNAEVERLSFSLAPLANVPVRTRKQCSVIQATYNHVTSQIAQTDSQLKQIEEDTKQIQQHSIELQEKLQEKASEIIEVYHQQDVMERQHQQSLKEVEQYKDASSSLLGDRALLESKQRLILDQLKASNDLLTQRLREKEKLQKHLKQSEMKEEQLSDLHAQLTRVKTKVQTELESSQQNAVKIGESMDKLEIEFQSLQKQFEASMGHSKDSSAQVSAIVAKIRELEKDLLTWSRKSHNHFRGVIQLQKAVDNATAERMRAECSLQQTENKKKETVVGLREGSKSVASTLKALKNVEALYNIVKNEKNMCMSQINTSQQKHMEMRDKGRILSTEMEILRGSAVDKTDQLQQQRSVNSAMIIANDNLRSEINQLVTKEAELIATLESANNAKEKLDLMIKTLETKHDQAKKQRSRAINERDDLIKTLNARSHELTTHYDMQHMQDAMLKDIELAVQSRQDDIQFLQIEMKELQGKIASLKRLQNDKQNLEEELVASQKELSELQKQVYDFEKKLTHPDKCPRWREICKKKDDPEELEQKLFDLMKRLAEKDERSLELDLIGEETQRLCKRTKQRLEKRSVDATNVARTTADYKMRINQLTKKLMATVSELSMYQAQAVQLQKELEQKQDNLSIGKERLIQGLPPTPEIEEEWSRIARKLMQTWSGKSRPDSSFLEEDEGTGQTRMRPNAYLPDAEGSLPIPKPFGPHAPFQPTQPPTHLRHFRRSGIKTTSQAV